MTKPYKHNEVLIELGSKIRQARKAKGLSLKEFAYESAIEKASLSRIENGRTNLTIFTLARICESLGIMKELAAQ